MTLVEHDDCLRHPIRGFGALHEVIPKHVNALGNITESLKSERKESPTSITSVAVPASHTRKPKLVAFALAETIGLGEFAGCHLFDYEI